jgi:hypothetical protein
MRPGIYQHDDERSYVINRTGLMPDFRGVQLLRAAAVTIKAMATPKAQGRRDGRSSAATWRGFGTSASGGRLAVARQS